MRGRSSAAADVGWTTTTGHFACDEQCSATEPATVLRRAPRPRLPTTSNAAPSDRFTRCSVGEPPTTKIRTPTSATPGRVATAGSCRASATISLAWVSVAERMASIRAWSIAKRSSQ